jgi:hypothetical protein
MTRLDIAQEPLRTLYGVMTGLLEDSVAAQERGEIGQAARLAHEAAVLGQAMAIVGERRDGLTNPPD